MATYKKRKFNWKSLISIVLVIGVVIGLAMGIKTIAKDETKTVNKLGLFEVGSISEETGEHVESKNTLYTKKAFECQGLTVTPDFDNKSKYQIFWYNEDALYFGCTEILESKFVGNVPECARYCRIVVFPEPVDENGKEIKDFTIKFYEKQSYVKSLKIEVNKDQTWSPVDYYQEALKRKAPESYSVTSIADPYDFYESKWIYPNAEENSTFVESLTDHSQVHCVVKVNCDNLSKFKVIYNDNRLEDDKIYIDFFDSDGIMLDRIITYQSNGTSYVCEIPEGTTYACFSVYQELKPIVINPYLPR